jgi:hypothetical protein
MVCVVLSNASCKVLQRYLPILSRVNEVDSEVSGWAIYPLDSFQPLQETVNPALSNRACLRSWNFQTLSASGYTKVNLFPALEDVPFFTRLNGITADFEFCLFY